jgi:beta-glucanase (GH16 family)
MYDSDITNNLVVSSQASYAQVKFKKDDYESDIKIDFDIQATKNGAVILIIEEQLTDEDVEIGDYSIQIRLLDAKKEAVLTLPPIKSCIHIQQPLFDKIGTSNLTDDAIVNQALTTYAAPLEAVTNEGTFNRKTWVAKEKITTAELNRMEDGITYNNTQLKNISKKIITDEERTKLSNLRNYDDSDIKTNINNIKNNLGAVDLLTTDKTIKGAINEVNTQCKDIVKKIENGAGVDLSDYAKKSDIPDISTKVDKVTGKGLSTNDFTTEEKNKLKGLSNYDDSGVKADINNIPNSLKLVSGANNTIKLMFGTRELSSITIDGGTVEPPTPNTYIITNNLSNATNSNNATSIAENASYNAVITANSNYRIKTVTVTMGGTDITNIAYSNGRINISSVTGNVVITVTTESVTSEITRYTITNNLSHATNSNSATSIEEKSSYTATITADSNYRIKNVTVTMYGTDITNDVYSGGKIIIPRVIGNIVITVTTEYVSGGGDESNLDGLLKDRLLVWHDEFDGQTLDTSKWRYATHNSGGSEQQAYTVARTANTRLENSNLILEAKKDGYVSGYTWSSGRIDTSGLAGFKYGRLEAKLKYDVVSGAFPAFWTIGTCAYYPTGENIHGVLKSKGTQWAQNGEIDMFEGRGTNGEIVQGGWYNQDDGKGNLQMIFGSKNIDASQYHVYAVEWTETTMIAYIDGVETGRKNISDITSWQRPQYIILNMAVGSTGGYPTEDCTSMKMEVDWVRVYAPVGVTEKTDVQSITLSQNNLSFNMGDDPIDVYYSVNPSIAWDNNVNYESSNTNVATVYGSRIYPIGTGNCKITARATNGVTATINVTVAQNTNINAKSIELNKNTLSIYNGTSSTLIATATPANHTDSILWKSSNTDVATVTNGVVTGKTKGICTITAYSSADSSVKAECSITVKDAVQLTGHPTSGLTLQLDRNGMSSTSWRNAIDNTQLQWKVATNNSSDIASYMVYDGDSFYWAGANYKDHLTLSGFSNYYDFGESQTVILAGDFTNAKNPIFSNKQKLSQNQSTAYINTNEVGYIGATGTKLGTINMTTQEAGYKIDGCIALRYNKQILRVDADTMAFTEDTVKNKNVVLSSAFTQGSYPALLGNVGTAGIYWKVVLVYNRVLSDTEIQTAMMAIKTFLNA